ncbi:MAG: amidohydrolase [Candidatus Palauibacterales bacterium]|nr:amidohydrolase [Candidatus Palauibacterales bacterium]MDP2584711.1 amidohydrolase [Candidatus Palauibacterales bacterium]
MMPRSHRLTAVTLAVFAVTILVSSLRAQQGPPPAIRTAHGDWYWERGPADLVLEHGKVVTVDSAQPRAEALAIRNRRIVAVGSDAAIARYVGPDTKVVDLRGRLAIPGFIDAHAHFMGLGESLKQLDLMGAPTWSDIVRKVAEAAKEAKPGEWILGQGWHQAKWEHPPHPAVEGLPLHASLDAVSPDNPVLLEHASGHAAFLNGKALELAGITDATPNPKGGEIVRDAEGHAIGMLRDNAQGLVRRVYQSYLDRRTPEQVRADMAETVRLASHDAVSTGVTGFDDQGESFATIDFLKEQVAGGKVPIRLYVEVESMSPDSLALHLPGHWLVGYGHDHLTVRAVGEILSDGALGTHSAWFLKPYADLPSTSGLNVTPIDQIRAEAEVALSNGFQVTVHAIGDRANREVLDTFQRIFREHPDAKDLRWRIEHAQHLDPADIPRFGHMRVIASMQTLHACSDGPYVVARLGKERAKAGAYAWRKLMDAGAIIANGTDAPVERLDPIPNFYCAVTRRLADGELFFPEEKMTREEALRSYTINAAYALFEEHDVGSLTPGKLGDVVVLSKDIMTIPADSIPTANVDLTIVGGRVVYRRTDGSR